METPILIGGIVLIAVVIAVLFSPSMTCPHCKSTDTHPTERDNILSTRYCNNCKRMYV